MALTLIHYTDGKTAGWGVVFDRSLAPLAAGAMTTGELIDQRWDEIWAKTPNDASIALSSVKLLSPVTRNQQFICQGTNYASHVRESGMDPKSISFNTIFTKASSSIVAADEPVARPAHVAMLDYEVELGLVMRCSIPAGTQVKSDELHKWLAGLVIVNDLSARDVQLPQAQFYKGKSYRGFGPVGPYLLLPTAAEWKRWPDLHMRLAVNGQTRQDAYCCEMIYQPAQTLTELAQLQDFFAGDLIATGTPAGCAARAPGKAVMFIFKHFVSEAGKWKLFIKKNAANPAYLRPGDQISVTIRTDDGALDLGEQTTKIVQP
ncbi:fumarylacetoacetate hydrolase family protein [Rhodoferax ferrireducens]|uniref:fumarylacetoacetate hydrolase family protein n=1 Tax=Rhodoferax ferrireducens TaxID=192843 RepID=UPI000E0D386C|nr:fumarylacetoacetate hydrolase family protein [Rhodoferax ferrireducens]